jgi:hypothetical protein
VADDLIPGAGTTDPNAPGSDAAGTGAYEDAGSLAGDDKVHVPKHEYMGLKQNAEDLNVLKRQVATLLAKRGAGAPAPTPAAPSGGASDERETRARAAVARIRQAAAEGNEDALAVVAIGEEAHSLHEQTRIMLEMSRVPEADQGAVETEMARTGIRSPNLVYKLIRESKLAPVESENTALKERIAELEKQRPSAPKDSRPIGESRVQAGAVGTKMGLSDYNAAFASHDSVRIAAAKAAREAGKVDLTR